MLEGRISSTQLAEFASQGLTRHLSFAVRALPRLREALGNDAADAKDAVTADVRFLRGPEGFPQLEMVVAGRLQVRCQRCLRPMACEVALEPTLMTVLENEGQTADLASPFDSVLLHEGRLDLAEVIEDELLAALPLAPMHPDVRHCAAPAVSGAETAPKSPESHRPFGGLAALLERGRDRAG